MNPKIQEFLKRGDHLLENGKYEEALEYFEKALSLDPDNPNIWNKKGVALRSMGRYGEAIECFNKSLEILPRDLDAS